MILEIYGDMIPEMDHKHFSQFWGTDVDAFVAEAQGSGIPLMISEETTRTLYWLLLAEYANSTIANADEGQFKNRLFATIFRYGPTWEKRLEIQKRIRELTQEEIERGGKQIYNEAEHPGTLPSTSSLEELLLISKQNTVNYKRDKLSAYGSVLALLKTDVTAEFIDRFRPLFLKCVAPQHPLLYRNLIEGDDEE